MPYGEEYKKPRQYSPPEPTKQVKQCRSSIIQPRNDIRVLSGDANSGGEIGSHTGMVVHKCQLEEHTEQQSCQCLCGHRWIRNLR